jgi:WD40 repeat protein
MDPAAFINLRVSPNNRIAATPNPGNVWVFDIQGNVIQRYAGPSPFAFEGDPQIATHNRILPQDVFLFLVSDDGSTCAATTMKRSFALMRNGRWELIKPSSSKGWCPRGMAVLSYHGTYLVTWGGGNVVTLGDPRSGTVLWEKPVMPDGEGIICCDFLLDEQSFVVLSEGSTGAFVRVVDLGGGTIGEIAVPKPPETSPLTGLLISPDGRWLSLCGDDGVDAYFFDLRRLELVFQINPVDLCLMIRARGGPCHGA